ncbi:MAG: LytTR family DNA-binding domain-containing protein [Bacteroidota bacterium]
MIKAIVIDDEKAARSGLKSLLKIYCSEVKVIAEASNIKEGKNWIEQLFPDLVFLDIALGRNNAFDLLEKLGNTNFQLIFITAHEEYAAQAFKMDAVHYLLKPIDPSDLKIAIQRIDQRLKQQQLEEQLIHLAGRAQNAKEQKLKLVSTNGFDLIDFDQILYIKGEGNYSTFHLIEDRTITVAKNLGHYKISLNDTQLFSCHQSYIINLNHIIGIRTKDENSVELADKTKLPISRNRKEYLMSILSKWSRK